MSKKVIKNIIYLKNFRPKMNSPYRADADAVISMYEKGEIKNIKTAINLISKLASKRPEITRSKINDYLEIKKMIEPKVVKSHLDKDLDEDADYTIKPATKQISLRSTPVPKVKVMQSIKKKAIAPKLERFL